MMAKEASLCLLFLSSLLISCSGTLVGFSYHERGENTWTSTSAEKTISFLQQSKVSSSQIRVFVRDHRILSTLTNSNVSVDLYLNKSQVEKFTTSSELKAHLVNLLPQLDIKSIIASCGSECLAQNEIPLLIHSLRSIHSTLSNILHVGREVKVSVAFPLPLLQKLNASSHEHDDIRKMLSFLKEMKSFVVIEDSIDGEYLSMGDQFVQSVIKRATLAASILPCKDVPLVLTVKSPIIPSSMEVAQSSKRVSKYLEPITPITKRIAALYVEVYTTEDLAQKDQLKSEEKGEFFPLSRREILSKIHRRRTLGDINSPTNTVFPTNPTPTITPPEDTPTIITVPSTTNPVTISPSNPAAMPVTVPSATPVPVPPTNPAVTNPATTPPTVPGSQQPVTSYPPPPSPPSGNVPVPVTNPQPQPPPPSNTNNAPASQGQSWCVAKTGAPQASLQAALDYACGMGGADCSQIQQGGSCYSPVTLQNHASFAFNSYYQKHPAPTSCDFGGAATLVNTNPSTGSCIFPSSSSSSSSSSTPMTPSPTPPTSSTPTPPTQSITTPPPSPTTPPPSMPTAPPKSSGAGTGTFGYGTPPSVLNSSSNPASSGGIMPGFGSDTPPVVNTTSASHSVPLKPFTGCIVLMMISFVTAKLSMHP